MRHLLSLLLSVAVLLTLPATAAAGTFCVPAFHPACPAGDGRVAVADLQTAMTTDPDDGQADRIVLPAGTFTTPETFAMGPGTDPLEIAGAGRELTVLTSAGSANVFVVNLDGSNVRATTLRDLMIRVPATFPDDQGAALQLSADDVLERVVLESRNPGSDAVGSAIGGGSLREVTVRGAAGGTIDDALRTNGAQSGTLSLDDVSIDDASWGIAATSPQVSVSADGLTIRDPAAYGAFVDHGATLTLTNAVITADTGRPLLVRASDGGSSAITARHVTIVALPGAQEPALTAQVVGAFSGSAQLSVSDSIIRGFPETWARSAPTALLTGDAGLSIRDSNLTAAGSSSGDGVLSTTVRNLDADPLFATPTYRLLPGSPSIDRGDPGGAALIPDLDGAPRPADGDGDGTARRDQGAYEYQPPAVPGAAGPGPPVPATAPPVAGRPADREGPQLSRLRVVGTARAGRRVRLALTTSEPARAELTLRRTVTRGRSSIVRRRFTLRAGRNVLTIRAGVLRAGRWRATVEATDAAGNRSARLRGSVTVRRALARR